MSHAPIWGRRTALPGPFTSLHPITRLGILACVLWLAAAGSLAWILALSMLFLGLDRPLRLPAGTIAALLRLALIPLALTALFHAIYGPGSGWLPRPSLDGLRIGALFAARFWVNWVAFSLFWATTSADELLRGFRSLPWQAPAFLEELGATLELAIRLTPLLGEEAEKLVLAQASRGMEWEGSLPHRAMLAAGLLVPMVQGTLRKGEEIGDLLYSRGFGSATPTDWMRPSWRARDLTAALVALGAAVLGSWR